MNQILQKQLDDIVKTLKGTVVHKLGTNSQGTVSNRIVIEYNVQN